jgi:hypothetical protein
MGVRFECPQGHQLHVKAHLAGKRGICPECGTRFVVPSFSGGRVTEAPEAPAGSSASSANNHTAEAAWYVRPAAGGQFGPVASEVFEQWVREGRVAADSWVWRTGWADWKSGREALAAGGDSSANSSLDSVAIQPADSGDDLAVPASASRRRDDFPVPKPGEALSTARRRRQQLNHRLTLILGLVAVVLIVVLAVVLSR